jgi:hypothetical protein
MNRLEMGKMTDSARNAKNRNGLTSDMCERTLKRVSLNTVDEIFTVTLSFFFFFLNELVPVHHRFAFNFNGARVSFIFFRKTLRARVFLFNLSVGQQSVHRTSRAVPANYERLKISSDTFTSTSELITRPRSGTGRASRSHYSTIIYI